MTLLRYFDVVETGEQRNDMTTLVRKRFYGLQGKFIHLADGSYRVVKADEKTVILKKKGAKKSQILFDNDLVRFTLVGGVLHYRRYLNKGLQGFEAVTTINAENDGK